MRASTTAPASPLPLWALFIASVLVPFAFMAIGFRLFYDSVIPEVAGLVLTGAAFAYLRPKYAIVWLVGIAIGITLSERVSPATPPPEHLLRYGPPAKGHLADILKISAFPAVGSVLGVVGRWLTGIARA